MQHCKTSGLRCILFKLKANKKNKKTFKQTGVLYYFMYSVFNATDAYLYTTFVPQFSKIKNSKTTPIYPLLAPLLTPPKKKKKSHEDLVWFDNAVEHLTLPANFKWLILKRGKDQERIPQSPHEHGQFCSQPLTANTQPAFAQLRTSHTQHLPPAPQVCLRNTL